MASLPGKMIHYSCSMSDQDEENLTQKHAILLYLLQIHLYSRNRQIKKASITQIKLREFGRVRLSLWQSLKEAQAHQLQPLDQRHLYYFLLLQRNQNFELINAQKERPQSIK